MSATFACPHCAQSYPLKPVLIGKVVRCTACKNPFRLREDGVAEAVEMPAPTPAPTPAPAAPSADEANRSSAARRAAADAAKAAEVKARMEEARKAMNADLAQAAGKALQSSAVKAEETADKGSSTRTKAAKSAGDGSGKRRIGPAVLSGDGEREAANSRRWLIGGVLAAVVIAGAAWLLSLDGPKTAAIEGFLAVVPSEQNTYGQRDVAIAQRGWLEAASGAVTPFIDLGTVRWGRTGSLVPTSYGAAISRLADHAPVPNSTLWVPAKDLAKALEVAAQASTEPLEKRLSAARIAVRPWSAIAKDLAAGNVDEDGTEVLRLLLSHAPAPGAPAVAETLRQGTATLEWVLASGTTGTYLQDLGGSYRTRSSPWSAVLVRQPGGPWRFLRLAPVRP